MPRAGRVLHSFELGFWLGVALLGGFEHAFGGPYLWLGWLEDGVALGLPYGPGGAFVLSFGVLAGDHDVLAGLQLFAEHAPLLVQVGQPARLGE